MTPLERIVRSLARAVTITVACIVGLYGAALASLALHEAGHAAATRILGGRILELRIDPALRGLSFVSSYYPFAERTDAFDAVWVALGGPLSSVALGLLAGIVVMVGNRRWALSSTAIVGATFGAIGFGALSFGVTGRRGYAADLVVFSRLLDVSFAQFRWAMAAFGIGTLAICAALVLIGIRRAAISWDEQSGALVSSRALVNVLIAGAAVAMWHFGAGWTTALVLIGLATGIWFIAKRSRRFSRSTRHQSIPIRNIVLEATFLVVLGVMTATAVRISFPGDRANPPIASSPKTEQELRLAAYWTREMGDPATALKYLEEARSRYGSIGALYDLGTAYRLAGRSTDAVEALSMACEQAPAFEACWEQLAAAYERANERKDAAAAWQTAATLAANDPDRVERERRVRLMLRRADALEHSVSP